MRGDAALPASPGGEGPGLWVATGMLLALAGGAGVVGWGLNSQHGQPLPKHPGTSMTATRMTGRSASSARPTPAPK